MTLTELINLGFDLSRPVPDSNTNKVRCSQCEALVINGVPAHETGCPNRPDAEPPGSDDDIDPLEDDDEEDDIDIDWADDDDDDDDPDDTDFDPCEETTCPE